MSEDKAQAFTDWVAEMSQEGWEAMQLTGKIISIAPAIGMALIQSRMVAWAVVGLEGWDVAVT